MGQNLDKLYEAVSAKFDIGDKESFVEKMQMPEGRKKFYDAVGGKGFDLGDYDSYENRLSGEVTIKKKESTTGSAAQSKPSTTNYGYNWSNQEPTQQVIATTNTEVQNVAQPTYATPELIKQEEIRIKDAQEKAKSSAAKTSQDISIANDKLTKADDDIKALNAVNSIKTEYGHLFSPVTQGIDQVYDLDERTGKYTPKDAYEVVDGNLRNKYSAEQIKDFDKKVRLIQKADLETSGKTTEEVQSIAEQKANNLLQAQSEYVQVAQQHDKNIKALKDVNREAMKDYGITDAFMDGIAQTNAALRLSKDAASLDDTDLTNELEKIYVTQSTIEKPESAANTVAEVVGSQALPMTAVIGSSLATGGVGGAAVAAATYGTMGYGQNLMQGYMQARSQGQLPNEALATAKSYAKFGAATGATEGVIGFINPFMRTGGLANKTLLSGVKTALKDASLDATVAMGMQYANNQYGQGLGLEIGDLDGILEQGAGEAAFSMGMNALFGVAQLKPKIHKQLVYGLAQSDVGSIKMAVDAGVKEGFIDAAKGGQVMGEILEAKKAFDKMPVDLDEETRIRLVPDMERKNALEKQLEDKDGSFAPMIEAEIETIDKDIREKIGAPLTEKESKEFDKLKEGGTEEKPLTTTEKAKLKHYEKRIKQADKLTAKKKEDGELVAEREGELAAEEAGPATKTVTPVTDTKVEPVAEVEEVISEPQNIEQNAEKTSEEAEGLLEESNTVQSESPTTTAEAADVAVSDIQKEALDFIDTHVGEHMLKIDVYQARPDFDMKSSELQSAYKQIKAGKLDGVNAKRMLDKIAEWKKQGYVDIIQGAGGMATKSSVPFEVPKLPDNISTEEIETLSNEYDEHYNSLTDEQKLAEDEAYNYQAEREVEKVESSENVADKKYTAEEIARIEDARRWSKMEFNIKRGENLTTEEYSKLRSTRYQPLSPEESAQLKADSDRIMADIKTSLGKTKKPKEPKPVKNVIGFQQLADIPNRLGQNWLADKVRQVEDYVAKTLQRASVSENRAARGIQDFLTSFSRGIINTEAYTTAQRQILKGTIGETKLEVEDFHADMWEMIGDNIESADRIHQVLDPELRQTGLTEADLTPEEQQLLTLLKQINEYTHNENYRLGKISKETFDKYKGKYIGREYDIERDYDFNLGKPLKETLGIYKQREDVDEFKMLSSIKDPIYLTLRRMMQTGQNRAVNEYAAWLNREHGDGAREQLVFDEERAGTVSLGNGFGDLSGKYVARHVAEDFKGFFYMNKYADMAYTALKAFDGLAPRQWMKELLTVGNPIVQIGNFTSNAVFSWLGGVDLPTFLAKMPEAISEINNKGDVYRFLVKEGLIGTDFVSADLKPMETLLGSDSDKNIVHKARSKARGLYGGADDAAKIQMYLALKDNGYSDAEATRTIFEALQNYQNTGRIWDVGSKLPVIGNPFLKFKPEMLRMVKNGLTRRPLHTIALLTVLSAMPKLIGKYFGDEDEEIEAAARQKGIPKLLIPFTDVDIPFAWRLGDKRVNVARFMLPLYQYDIGGEDKKTAEFVNKFSPLEFTTTETGGFEPKVNDPFLGPIVSLIRNRDFRDKPIVEETDNSTDKLIKKLRYGARSYGGFFGQMADDIASTAMTGEDYYGRRKTATDVALNTIIKIETFDDERLKEGIQREFDGYERTANHLYSAYTKKRKALSSDLEQAEKDKTLTPERRKELTARANEKLQKLANTVLEDVAEIQQEQIKAADFYRLLSRKTPYQSLQKEFKKTEIELKKMKRRIDGRFKN